MIKVYVDGACSGNPGKIGIGYLIYREGNLLKENSLYLGVQTNNFAEYMALIFALIDVLEISPSEECRVYSDSKLMCEQVNGNYKVKNNNIYPLFILAKKLISKFDKFTISHIERERNGNADKLARRGSGLLGNGV